MFPCTLAGGGIYGPPKKPALFWTPCWDEPDIPDGPNNPGGPSNPDGPNIPVDFEIFCVVVWVFEPPLFPGAWKKFIPWLFNDDDVDGVEVIGLLIGDVNYCGFGGLT